MFKSRGIEALINDDLVMFLYCIYIFFVCDTYDHIMHFIFMHKYIDNNTIMVRCSIQSMYSHFGFT